MAGYAVARPVSLEDIPGPRIRPATVPAVGPNAVSPAATPAAPFSTEVVTSEVARRDRPSIRSFIPERLRNTLGDAASGIANADPRAGAVGAFAQAFAGAQDRGEARDDKAAAAALAADERALKAEDRAYNRSRDTVEDERWQKTHDLAVRKAESDAGGKYMLPDGTDLSAEGYFKIYDLSSKYHAELTKSYGLSSSKYPTGPRGAKQRQKDMAEINALVADYNNKVREAVLNGKDPASVPKPAVPAPVEGEPADLDGDGRVSKRERKKAEKDQGKMVSSLELPPGPGGEGTVLVDADTAERTLTGKGDALTPTPAALKFAGNGTMEQPYTGFSTEEQFKAKVPVGSYYLGSDGDIYVREK